MADEALMQMIADAAGLGDEQAQAQLDLLRARKLRDQVRTPKNYDTPGAALGGGIADIIYGVQSGRDEARAQAAGAAADQKRNALVRALAGKTGMDAPQYRALSRALMGPGDPTLAAIAKGYETEAGALDKSELQAAKAEADFLRKKYEVDNPPVRFTPTPGTPDAGWYTTGPGQTPRPVGQNDRIGPDGKPLAGPGTGRPQFKTVVVPGIGPVVHLWDGSQWVPTTAAQGGAAVSPPPVLGPGVPQPSAPPARPAAPAVQPKSLPPTDSKALEQYKITLRDLETLVNGFDDRFAGQGITGNLAARGAAFVGSSNVPFVKDEALANWYQLLQQLLLIPKRHQIAGTAVTPMENRIFEAAQNINLSNSPAIIRREFARLLSEAQSDLAGRVAAHRAAGYSDTALDALTGGQSGATAVPKFTRDPATGKLVKVKP